MMENDKLFELMEKMYGEMKQGFSDNKQEFKEIKQNQARFESGVNDKLDSLFDGYVQNTEAFNRTELNIRKIERRMDNLESDMIKYRFKNVSHV